MPAEAVFLPGERFKTLEDALAPNWRNWRRFSEPVPLPSTGSLNLINMEYNTWAYGLIFGNSRFGEPAYT